MELGVLEELVLLAIANMPKTGYGVTIHGAVEEARGRPISFGVIYTTLDRLEKKGYISSELADPTPERGGRAKRYYRLKAEGQGALERQEQMRLRLNPAALAEGRA